MIPRRLIAAGCHLRLARLSLSPPAGSLRSPPAGRVESTRDNLLLLQVHEPGDVRALFQAASGDPPPDDVRAALYLAKKATPWPWSSPSVDPPGAAGRKVENFILGDGAKLSIDGLPEPDDVQVAACVGRGGSFPYNGEPERAKDGGFLPQAREWHTVDEPDNVRDAVSVGGGGSCPHAGLAGGKAVSLLPHAPLRALSHAFPDLDASLVDAGVPCGHQRGTSPSTRSRYLLKLATAGRSASLDALLAVAGVVGRNIGTDPSAPKLLFHYLLELDVVVDSLCAAGDCSLSLIAGDNKLMLCKPEPHDAVRPTRPLFSQLAHGRLCCPPSIRAGQRISGNKLYSTRSYSTLPSLPPTPRSFLSSVRPNLLCN